MSENQSWREEFRKKFGRFYVSQLGTIDIEGAESIASDDVEYFIESQIAAAEARVRLDAAREIGLAASGAGLKVEHLERYEDWHAAVEFLQFHAEARGMEEMRELIFSKIPKEVGGDGELSEYKRGHDDAVIEFRAAFKDL